MFEMRWLERNTGRKLMNEWGYYYPETERVLQYRHQRPVTDYSSENMVTVTVWSDWQNVPVCAHGE